MLAHDIENSTDVMRTFAWQEKYDEANALYQQALAIDEKVYGRDHLEVAADLTTWVGVLEAQVSRMKHSRRVRRADRDPGPFHTLTSRDLVRPQLSWHYQDLREICSCRQGLPGPVFTIRTRSTSARANAAPWNETPKARPAQCYPGRLIRVAYGNFEIGGCSAHRKYL